MISVLQNHSTKQAKLNKNMERSYAKSIECLKLKNATFILNRILNKNNLLYYNCCKSKELERDKEETKR